MDTLLREEVKNIMDKALEEVDALIQNTVTSPVLSAEEEKQRAWDIKCEEARLNGAVFWGHRGTGDHNIRYYIRHGGNDVLHRTGGPAIEGYDGLKEWFINGSRHRADGPAIVTPNGKKSYYVNGHTIDILPSGHGDAWDLKCLKAFIDGAEIRKGGEIVYVHTS